VTDTLKSWSRTELLVSAHVRQVAKASSDLADPLQISQSLFACSCKIILSAVPVCFHDTSMSVLQLEKRPLSVILACKNSVDDGYLMHPLIPKNQERRGID
jgi:hypothetical protein